MKIIINEYIKNGKDNAQPSDLMNLRIKYNKMQHTELIRFRRKLYQNIYIYIYTE